MPCTISECLNASKVPFFCNVPMAERTTLRVGGPAAFWVEPRSEAELSMALQAAARAGVSAVIIGNGSNLLVRDEGIDGLVICIGARMSAVSLRRQTMRVQAGARVSQAAAAAQAAGLSGLEAISGVPGTLGGALCMNAGCYGVEIADLVQTVRVMDTNGNTQTLNRQQMDFAYRHSVLQNEAWIALEATLRLKRDTPEAIGERMRAFAAQRRAKQPLRQPSAGSFFKRPEGTFAALLIEQAGLKGLVVGGAQVSRMHSGFLVNTGGATAEDFLALMAKVQQRVQDMSGIWLMPEVKILG